MKKIKRFLTVLVLCLQILFLGNYTNAANINETKDLERAERGYYCVQKWDGSKWIYLTYNRTYYTDTDGQKHVAYCLSPGKPGVGYVSGEKETYQVKIKEVLNDDAVWRIVTNGYPYKNPEEMGVETADDAYFATMQAINCFLRGYTLEQAKQLYSPGKFAIYGENLTDIQRRGTKTLNAMYNLLDKGINGTQKRSDLLNISINKVTDFVKENNEFYSQTFKIESSSEISQYSITNLEKFPEGTFTSDLSGNKKSTFEKGESFKVMIPKNKILNDINGKISVKAQQKNYPVFYSESMLDGYQDYALCTDVYSDAYANAEVFVYSNKSKLIINKIDSETHKPIKGVKFQITNSEGIVSTFLTDENGIITIANLRQGNITIKELETVGKYKLDTQELKVKLGYDETKEVKIENKLKKTNIKIIKVDKDNEKIKLAKVKFQLKDENNKVVKEGITDKNGELIFENIVIGKYKIVEVETNEEYVPSNQEIEIELEYGKTKEVIVKNELKKSNIKIIKVDKDNEKIKLADVKFQLKDENNKVVKEGVTDKNGELVFENIVIGKYKIVEVETNEEYVPSNQEIEVELEYGKTKEVVVKNELKKTNIKIIKVDKDNEKIKLENVKFQLKDENNKVVKEGITDKNGELVFENIVIGKYKIVEVETNEEYVPSNQEIEIELEYGKTKEVIVKNELKKSNIKIIKVDKDNNNVKLKDVKFHLLDENNTIVKEGLTDENGELVFENVLVGKYKIVEFETCEGYIPFEEEILIDLEYGKTKEVVIENKKIPQKPIQPEEQVKPDEPQKSEQPEAPQEPIQPEKTQKIEENIVTETKELPKTGNEIIFSNNIISYIIIIMSGIILCVKNL